MAYKYGVSGSFWYASGATVQVLLFAVLAIELKKRAPNAHTFLEIVYARYGKATHIVYLCFALATNIVCALHHSCRDVRMVYIDKLLFHSIGCISYASARWKCCCFLLN